MTWVEAVLHGDVEAAFAVARHAADMAEAAGEEGDGLEALRRGVAEELAVRAVGDEQSPIGPGDALRRKAVAAVDQAEQAAFRGAQVEDVLLIVRDVEVALIVEGEAFGLGDSGE